MTQALILANALAFCDSSVASQAAAELRAQHARIAELESTLDAIGAGGVEPLRKPAAAQQAVQDAVPLPLLLRDIARDLGITVPEACNALKPLGNYSTNSAVTAEMARMLRKHFPAPAHPAEGVPAQAAPAIFGDEDHVLVPRGLIGAACSAIDKKRDGTKTLAELRRYTTGDLSAATHPTQQGLDAEYLRGYQDGYNRRDAEVKGALV